MKLRKMLSSIKSKVYWYRARALIVVFGKLFKIKKQVLFESFNGMNYSDNPRAISEKLREVDPSFKIIWAFTKKASIPPDIPGYVKIVNRNSWRFYKELASSFTYIKNTQYESWTKKRNGKQLFFQPWHGDRPMKKILYLANPVRKDAIFDDIVVDYCISGSSCGTQMYRNAFKYTGEILEIGCPRNDVLFSNERISLINDRIRKKYEIEDNVKILLYAPTFRDNNNQSQMVLINVDEVINRLESTTKCKWVCLLRAHPNVIHGMYKYNSKNIIDASSESDAADLLCATDMLITDYSTIATDYMLRDKPIILAVFDEDKYKRYSRDFQILPEETGLITAKTNEELLSIITQTSLQDYENSCKEAKAFFGVKETGEASIQIVNIIINLYKGRYGYGKTGNGTCKCAS